MNFQHILVQQVSQTCVISFNRPDVYNAMNVLMKKEIIKAIKIANQQNDIRSIILTGIGAAFSSGQDLNDRTVKADEGPVDLGKTLETEWNPLIETIRSSDKIVIAAINGVCAGAGLSVAMACDLKISTAKAKFVSGFCAIGLTLDAGMDHVFVRALGQSRALEFALLGKPFMAKDMLHYDLVNYVCTEDEKELDIAQKWAEQINSLPPLSVKTIKKNLLFAQDHSFHEVIERETASQRFLGNSEDYKEGVDAFFNKRKPNFTGK